MYDLKERHGYNNWVLMWMKHGLGVGRGTHLPPALLHDLEYREGAVVRPVHAVAMPGHLIHHLYVAHGGVRGLTPREHLPHQDTWEHKVKGQYYVYGCKLFQLNVSYQVHLLYEIVGDSICLITLPIHENFNHLSLI